MKIKQSQLKPGDIILMGSASSLRVGKVSHTTKSGSVKYFYTDNLPSMDYQEFMTGEQAFDKSAYIPKPWVTSTRIIEKYVWLLDREN